MSFSPFKQPQDHTVIATIAVEPIYHLLTAMSLLTASNLETESKPWLSNTVAKLTPDQRHTNRLIFEWFGAALLPVGTYTTFTSFLTTLDKISPPDLVQRALQGWPTVAKSEGQLLENLAKNKTRFIKFATAENPDLVGEQELLTKVHQLINDPPALHALISTHFRMLWERHFASEWAKKLPAMRYCSEELNARTWPNESANALLKAFIRGAIPDAILSQLSGVRQIKIVLSPYIQLHTSRMGSPDTLWLFMLVDFWQLPMRTEPIQKGEIKGAASALADDTRLKILELLAAHDELRSQEIIAQMDTSQSTVSRHLKQLASARFITEKRANSANKIYRLNRARTSEFAYSLATLLSTENAHMVLNDVRLEHPSALQPYLDRNGLITNWPAKKKGQSAVLEYLIGKLGIGETYTEKQINELLTTWHSYGNHAYLRRSLVDSGLLERTSTGSEYWRAES